MLFWPEISALGVFFNFDNKRMRPPKYPSAPPPPPPPGAWLISEHVMCSDATSGDLDKFSLINSEKPLHVQTPRKTAKIVTEIPNK